MTQPPSHIAISDGTSSEMARGNRREPSRLKRAISPRNLRVMFTYFVALQVALDKHNQYRRLHQNTPDLILDSQVSETAQRIADRQVWGHSQERILCLVLSPVFSPCHIYNYFHRTLQIYCHCLVAVISLLKIYCHCLVLSCHINSCEGSADSAKIAILRTNFLY